MKVAVLIFLVLIIVIYFQLTRAASNEYAVIEISLEKEVSDLEKLIHNNVDDAIIKFKEAYDKNRETMNNNYNDNLFLVDELWKNTDKLYRNVMAKVIKEESDCLADLWSNSQVIKNGALASLRFSLNSNIASNKELQHEVHQNLTNLKSKFFYGIEAKLLKCRFGSDKEICWLNLYNEIKYNEMIFKTLFPAIQYAYSQLFSIIEKRSTNSFHDISLQYYFKMSYLLSTFVKCF